MAGLVDKLEKILEGINSEEDQHADDELQAELFAAKDATDATLVHSDSVRKLLVGGYPGFAASLV